MTRLRATRAFLAGVALNVTATMCMVAYSEACRRPGIGAGVDQEEVGGMRYRKKPVVIEAMQLAGGPAQWHEVYQWIERNTFGSFEPLDVIEGRKPYPASGVSIDPRDGRLIISTLEGLHWADPEDWIIRGVQGEFYPCKSDVFEATYERVADDERTDSVSEVRGDEAP